MSSHVVDKDLLGVLGLGPGARLVVMDREPLPTEARALIDEQTAAGQREPILDQRPASTKTGRLG